MRLTQFSPAQSLLFTVATCLLAAGCSSNSDGGGSNASPSTFAVTSISVQSGSMWEINRPIDVVFNKEVDFSSVSLNTINITSLSGLPATGSFALVAPNVVRFQPTCPTMADSSDAGLLPGGVTYQLVVLGTPGNGLTVQAMDGDSIEDSLSINFFTPMPEDVLFVDTQPGPPVPLIRCKDGIAVDDMAASYVEVGGDPDDRRYFYWDPATQMGLLYDTPPATCGAVGTEALLPINQYSVRENQVAVIIQMNQPVDPALTNISPQQISLSYNTAAPVGLASIWESVITDVELVENCTESGSSIRLTPQGILPQGSALRVDLREGFSDLAGNTTFIDSSNFAMMRTGFSTDPGTMTPGEDGDEILEPFVLSGTQVGSLEDTEAAFLTPQADWGSGSVRASFDFAGTGGAGGNFDWRVPAGEVFILDTTSASITGGPSFQQTTVQAVINGVIDVRNMEVPAGAHLVIQGPNPCTILASGTVNIEGILEISGTSSRGVGTLNTTNLPEPGASGQGGGGDGGVASFLTSQSTPRGGSGNGPFNITGGGGQGGEASYSQSGNNARRGAGGGGGRLGEDVEYLFDGAQPEFVLCQEQIGMDAEPGFHGGPNGTSAVTDTPQAVGGAVGPDPFTDSSERNNFFGTMLTADNELILGELSQVWAGSGGGGGGDSVNSASFPLTPFNISGDEKGSGGGGGAGGLVIFAIGTITIVEDATGDIGGQVIADGGTGGGGENTNFLDRVGGGSGAGSGGHIVLSSASQVIIGGAANGAEDFYNEDDVTGGGNFSHNQRAISALGGQGGAGNQNKGGAGNNGVGTTWRCDAIPRNHFGVNFEPQILQPPGQTPSCGFPAPDATSPVGPVFGAGGDGSPGIVQIHVDDPANNIVFPQNPGQYGVGGGLGADISKAVAPPPLGWLNPTDQADELVPFFGKDSTSQSKWIALGLPQINPDGMGGFNTPDDIEFLFSGTDPFTGEVLRSGIEVDLDAPLLAPATLMTVGTTPFLDESVSENTIVFDVAALADDIYKRNPALLREFTVRLEDAAALRLDFNVASATYDPGLDRISATVASTLGTTLVDFRDDTGTTAPITVSLIPRFFKMRTSGLPDFYPLDTSVRITFDATRVDAEGNPDLDPTVLFSAVNGDFATDINDLNIADWDFFRFRVQFDLNTAGGGIDLTTPRPSLTFMRMPFRF